MMNNGIMSVAQRMQRLGRDGDTILAHINPEEARNLMAMGGRGSINPATGLPEFAPVDPLYYLSVNPAVMQQAKAATRAAGIAPGEDFQANMFRIAQEHFDNFGEAEGRAADASTAPQDTRQTILDFERDPQAFADFYGGRNPIVAEAIGTDPQDLLRHYLQFGVGETDFSGSPDVGRLTDPSQIVAPPSETFDGAFYAANNPDVVSVYGSAPDRLYRHFLDYGQAEGRLGKASGTEGEEDNGTGNGEGRGIPTLGNPIFPNITDLPEEPDGRAFSAMSVGDVFTPADRSGIETIRPEDATQRLADQGVGIRFYIMVPDANGVMQKQYVPPGTPGAIREVQGIYGTSGGEFDFFPNELGTIPAELDVEGILNRGSN